MGVLRNYCNHNLATRQVNELVEKARASTPTDHSGRQIPSRANPKLASDQVKQLIDSYKQGDSTYSLARRFGIRRDQVSIILKRAGIEVWAGPVGMRESDKDRAAELYLSGLSLRKVGAQLGVTDNTVIKALNERGAKRRDPHGRVL